MAKDNNNGFPLSDKKSLGMPYATSETIKNKGKNGVYA